jgi:type I restriction enzyme S subunit
MNAQGTDKTSTLGHLLSITKGQVYDASLAGEDGPVLLGMGIFSPDGGFRTHKLRRYSGEVLPEGKVIPGSVVVATTDMGANIKILGRSASVPTWVGEFAVATGDMGVARWQTDDPKLRAYAYWVMRTEAFRQYCLRFARGTAVRRIHPRDIEKFPIPDTNAPHLLHILDALQALDDKIELNRQMNATLEAMARALFQSWFVDFDPVRAKLDGREPVGLDPGTAALFPDSFHDSAFGHIPKGWKFGTIQDCCVQIQNGGTPRRNEPRFWYGGNIPWLASGEVRQSIITATESFITEEGLAESSAKWVPSFSTVVALYGATAGQVSFTSCHLTTNQAVCALIPKQDFAFFNYFTMREATTELENKAVGSAQQNISKGIVEETKVVLPPPAVVERFAAMVRPIFERWISNLNQSRSLAILRDTLLPKLLSGELSIETPQN